MNNQENTNAKNFEIKEAVQYASNAVVSKTIIKKPTGTVTLFAFDKGEELSEHTAPFEALVQVIDGVVSIKVGVDEHEVKFGEAIILPANIPHSLRATEKFKMILTMIKS